MTTARFVGLAAARSDAGCVRPLNEDSVVCSPPVFAIADGMGGHAAGDVASAVAADVLNSLAQQRRISVDVVRSATALANRRIREVAGRSGATGGMGTTIVGFVLGEPPLAFNVGDSRLYLLREGELHQLSRDHSFVQELVDQGRITADQARAHPQRNVVTRAVGVEPDVEVDVWEIAPEPGDRMLVCSDGLSGELSDEHICRILRDEEPVLAAADALVRAALDAGGRDNVSVVVVDVIEEVALSASDDDTNLRGVSDDTNPRRRPVARVTTGSASSPEGEHASIGSVPITIQPERSTGQQPATALIDSVPWAVAATGVASDRSVDANEVSGIDPEDR